MKLKHFETVSDIQENRKQYLTALWKMISRVFLKHGENNGITVYVTQKTILKEMSTKIEYDKPGFFLHILGTF
jgi:hypothetical protein